MRLLIQRVNFSNVLIENTEKREIKKGLLVYLGIKKGENEEVIDKAVSKLLKLRFFENEEGKLKLNVQDVEGEIMLISNFSLYANAKKGTTLSFDEGANAEEARKIYDIFAKKLKKLYNRIQTGEFRSYMQINSVADGPVNVILDF